MSPHHDAKLKQMLPRCYGLEVTLRETYALATRVHGVPGDIVECGIAMAAQLCAMKLGAPEKIAWGFDSFEGIELAGKEDTVQPGVGMVDPARTIPENRLVSSGVTAHRKTDVENIITEWGFPLNEIRLIEGWVQHAMAKEENLPEKVAILRLDMDMHDPTLFALEKLWPRMPVGAVLIVDDWPLKGVQVALQTYFSRIGYTPDWQTPNHTGWLIKT
jgi:O-methyltransferase